MKAAQVGATECGNNWAGYVIDNSPAPMMMVLPSLELAKRNSRQRIDPLIEESPRLRRKVAPSRARDSGNTMLSKEFPGGVLVLTGANSAVGLRSMPARFLFCDEVDGYPPSADEEGDPISLVEARSQTFGVRRKLFLVSTPTTKGMSRIEREYEASDRRRFFVACPACGHRQHLIFERLRWEKGKPDTAAYTCEGCEVRIAEHHKAKMLATGEWRATAKASDPRHVGFHINALYSPPGWLTWADIAKQWVAAQGSDDAKRAFRNTVLGETWAEASDAPSWELLAERREEGLRERVVPAGGLFLTAGVDVQKDRIEADVWAWGRGLESWLVDHRVFDGGPHSPDAWRALTDMLGEAFPAEVGPDMRLTRVAVDTGYEAAAVYGWARQQGWQQVAPVKGEEGFNRASPVAGPTYVDVTLSGRRIKSGARLWKVATATFKAETYRFLRLPRPMREEIEAGQAFPAGSIHLPGWVDPEWLRQLTAEQLVTRRDRRGFAKLEWQKQRDRNEALDLRVYARAAAWIAGADRWSDRQWEALEMERAGDAPGQRRGSPETGGRSGGWLDTGKTGGWL